MAREKEEVSIGKVANAVSLWRDRPGTPAENKVNGVASDHLYLSIGPLEFVSKRMPFTLSLEQGCCE